MILLEVHNKYVVFFFCPTYKMIDFYQHRGPAYFHGVWGSYSNSGTIFSQVILE